MRVLVIATVACVLAGCVKSSVIPLSIDTFQITAGAAPICGAVGAQDVAVKQAAAETIRRGFDKFMIVGGAYQNDVRVIGHTPVVADTTSSATAYGGGGIVNVHGQSTTTFSGGQPIVGGTHNQALMVKMFKADDPAGGNAIDARAQLGPEWQKAVESGTNTCM